MKNKGLFSTLFIEDVRDDIKLDDHAKGRMATLTQTWRGRDPKSSETLWDTFMKQALGYLQFVPANAPTTPGVYPLFEDFGFSNCLAVLYLLEPGADIDDVAVGRFWPAKLLRELKQRKLNWGILSDGAQWRLYSTKSARPYEDFVELPLADALEKSDESEYALFERFFHKDSFLPEAEAEAAEQTHADAAAGVYKCRLDRDGESSEETLQDRVKGPLLYQVDEVLQYLCNGLIADTPKKGAEYTEEERAEIFQSAVKLLYRCLFLFYAEARRLLPSESDKAEKYNKKLSIHSLCEEACKFRWGHRKDDEAYDLWKHLKGLIAAVNTGDPEYGIMGYDGGLFDDAEEKFLGHHKLRNDFLARALYLLAYVEPLQADPDDEYEIPYADLEVRHLGEMYENILEFAVMLADADRVRRRTKDGIEIRLASEITRQKTDTLIKKGDVYFGETAMERKQTGSFYTPQPLVRFLNEKAIIVPLRAAFEERYRKRFDQLLKEARSGYDDAARRGAASSAASLVEQFVNEVVLPFKVCDLGMGSGHFLVDAANQIAGLIVDLLAEIPDVKGLRLRITSEPNYWRRLVTRHCLYGVDLNPLAVNLARLSLWLNCFATDHKLTFLDHHLRCGNSLIGLRSLDQLKTVPERKLDRSSKSKAPQLPRFDDLSEALAHASKAFLTIDQIAEDDTDKQKAAFEKARDAEQQSLQPLADLLISYLMDNQISQDTYRELFAHFAAGRPPSEIRREDLKETWSRVTHQRKRHNFFHWALAFPDIFARGTGFQATAGNPPWDIVKPNSHEFFSAYDPAFRGYEKQKAIKVSEHLMDKNPSIRQRWNDYCEEIAQQSVYVREEAAYSAVGKGDINTFKLFLEQFFNILRPDGRMGILVPSGLYTDQGCLPLRKMFFDKSRIDFLYCFENRWPVVFAAVHNSFKFVAFCTQKGGKTEKFKCAFMQRDPERLPAIEASALEITNALIEKVSPKSLAVPELNTKKDVQLVSHIFDRFQQLGETLKDTWSVALRMGDYHLTNDSYRFETIADALQASPSTLPEIISELQKKDRCAVMEGKNCWFFDSEVSLPTLCVTTKNAQGIVFSGPRVGFRRIAASTNERTLVLCVIPSGTLCTYGIIFADDNAPNPLTLQQRCFFAGLIGSLVLDFVIRFQISTSISNANGYGLPVPRINHPNGIFDAVAARVCRLLSASRAFADLWTGMFSTDWKSAQFWYPGNGAMDYGPAHEREIRKRLADSTTVLSRRWTEECGVHERLADGRDKGDRSQLRAEIDAYAAHLYGLKREDLAYILDTFPVLQKKEQKAFGEFQSKRKCLEEYDRLAKILKT